MIKIYKAAGWVASILAIISCKMIEPTGADAKDFSLTKNIWNSTITNAVIYISPAQLIEEFHLSENVANATQTEALAEKVRIAIAASNDETLDGTSYTFVDRLKDTVSYQLKFLLRDLEKYKAAGALQRISFTNLEVVRPQQPLLPGQEFAKSSELIAIKYSARVPIAVQSDATLPASMTVSLPKSVDDDYLKLLMRRFDACIVRKPDKKVTIHNFFYYLDKSQCHFAKLNAGQKYFYDLEIQLVSQQSSGGGSPEYNRMWEDHKFVGTFVFSQNNADDTTEDDVGTRAYLDFYAGLKSIPGLTIIEEQKRSPYNISFKMNYPSPASDKPRMVDLQIVKVSEIEKIDHELGKLIFGDRIGPSDFFMYNGHAGYGANVKHLRSIIRPQNAQYVLFFLNGCQTYGYTDIDSPNFDVIANIEPSYFIENAQNSLRVLEALLKEKDYKHILQLLPKRQEAIVTGEDVPSCPVN